MTDTGRRNLGSIAAVVIGRVPMLVAGPVAMYLVLLHGTLAAAAAVVVCLALAVWTRPDVAQLMLLGLVPVAAAADPEGTFLPTLVLGTVVLLLFRAVLSGVRPRLDVLLILLLACAVTVSCLLPQESFLVGRQWKACALLLTGLGVLTASVLAPPDPRRIAQVVATSGAGVAAYLLVRGEYASGRLTGLGLNPNYLGAAVSVSLVAGVGLARFSRSWQWLVPVAVSAAALLQTRSRGAFLAAGAGLACVLLVDRPRRHKVLIAAAILAAVTVLPGSLDSLEGGLTGSRTSAELTANSEVRKQAALLAVHVAWDHPLRGIGYAMFPEFARSSPSLGIYINTHNDYLRLAAESGLVTLALLGALLWRGLARRLSGHHATLQSLGVAYAVGLLFANVLTNVVISTPFWVSLGCLLAHGAHRKPAPSLSPPSRESRKAE
ncbi:O-antigen ligase family protein [Streptomyces tropicalis]|uniref:O-antigen ligase family protein n=1 Tax=Streptomyces tropicalis TaxID=3034234 RepID=A0ABT5ZZQ3_9ACTN|nr:O-antigen ligase family protein [Streptomyces tropicalis]MDF3297621.1 O-antigen ligase family protein [Streptomyces tropicalis]